MKRWLIGLLLLLGATAFALPLPVFLRQLHGTVSASKGGAGGGPFTPSNLGSRVYVWFDASDTNYLADSSGNAPTNNGSVFLVKDKSGNGRSAYRAGANQHATYVATFRGIGALKATGDTYMHVSNSASCFQAKTNASIFLVASDANNTASPDWHTYFAARYTWLTTNRTRFSASSRWATTNGWHAVVHSQPIRGVLNVATNTYTNLVVTTLTADWPNGLLYGSFNGGSQVSGSMSVMATSHDTTNHTVSFFGVTEAPSFSQTPMVGSFVCELVVVDDYLTAGEFSQVVTYLTNKWSVP